MIVVSDTSPLRYLAVLGHSELLPTLLEKIACPPRVMAECRDPQAPSVLQEWAASPPDWLTVMKPSLTAVAGTERLDEGEAEAICLAVELEADLLVIAERRGSRVAQAAGLETAGTLTVIAEAANRSLVDFDATVAQLRNNTNFRVSDEVVGQIRASLEGS